jgi:hypothetical protein
MEGKSGVPARGQKSADGASVKEAQSEAALFSYMAGETKQETQSQFMKRRDRG